MSKVGGYYSGGVLRVVDGDTLDLLVDVGFFVSVTVRVRLRGVYAPEVESEAGKKCKDKLEELCPIGGVFHLQTFKTERYGRWVANVWSTDEKKTVNDEMKKFIYGLLGT